jgi:hypothetical protein
MRIMRNVLIVLVAIVAIIVIGVALTCNGNDDGDDAADETPEASTPLPGDEELRVTVDAIIVVVRDGDGAELGDYLGAGLAEQVDEGDLDGLAGCIPEGVTLSVLDRTLEVVGNDASATLEFELTTADGQTSDAIGVWNFERGDAGTWLLKDLPPCPLDSP